MKNPAAPPVTSMMESDQFLERFLRLQIWTANGRREPHKPLLELWVIGRCLKRACKARIHYAAAPHGTGEGWPQIRIFSMT